jgi:mandelate racemase
LSKPLHDLRPQPTSPAAPILEEPLPVIDGTVTARGPGLGMEWDERAVAKCAA